tara:strand:+ start:236 stop:526 length:291 start_codon:yes stop_codon:yes gene_type:complete
MNLLEHFNEQLRQCHITALDRIGAYVVSDVVFALGNAATKEQVVNILSNKDEMSSLREKVADSALKARLGIYSQCDETYFNRITARPVSLLKTCQG